MSLRCGIVGVALTASVLGGDPDELPGVPAAFIQGLMRGLSGDAEDFHDCTVKVGVVVQDTKQLAKDVRGRNFSAVIDDLRAIYHDLTDLSPGQRRLQLRDGPADPDCKYDDSSAGERQMWLEGCKGTGCMANTMDADCAWCVYDLDLCKSRFGDTCDETVASRQAQGVTTCGGSNDEDDEDDDDDDEDDGNGGEDDDDDDEDDGNGGEDDEDDEDDDDEEDEEDEDDSEVSSTMLPTTSPVAPTTSPVAPTTSPVAPTTSQVAPTTSPVTTVTSATTSDENVTTAPVTNETTAPLTSTTTMSAAPPSNALVHGNYGGSCQSAIEDLKPLLNIIDGPPAKNAAQHFVDSYDDIVQLSKLVTHCGFADPDGEQCGYMIGAITRDIFAGAEFENVLMV